MRQFITLPMLVGHPDAGGSAIAAERPRENLLRRYRAPRWVSGLFHLSCLGYVLQPGRYEGPVSYFHREVAGRVRQLCSPTQVNVREYLEQPIEPRRRSVWPWMRLLSPGSSSSLRRRIVNRLRPISYSIQDIVTGREPYWPGHRPRKAPLTSGSPPARLTVGCYANWLDFDDAVRFLTPHGSGRWNDVAFVPAGSLPTDWIGIFNRPRQREVEVVCSPNRTFFAIGEPPTRMHRPLHLGQGPGTTVFTCDRDLVTCADAARDFILTPPMLRTWTVRRSFEQLCVSSIRDKPRQLSWITSDVSVLPGHRKRLQFLQRLRKGLGFDLYGRGFRRVYDKWDVLAPYRYSIAFENVCAPGYFTEKLMDCYVCETMPIYIGDPSITGYFPKESLMVVDPDAPDVIEQIRSIIESDVWRRNRDAVLEAKRRVLHEYNVFAMLSRWVSAQTGPAAPAIAMRFTSVQLEPDEKTGPA